MNVAGSHVEVTYEAGDLIDFISASETHLQRWGMEEKADVQFPS